MAPYLDYLVINPVSNMLTNLSVGRQNGLLLSIIRETLDYYDGPYDQRNSTIVWGLPNRPACSPKIVDALRRQEMADTRDMATLNDYKLLQISWVFDVNFAPTLGAVYERQYVQKIAATLTPGIEVERIVETVLAYLLNR